MVASSWCHGLCFLEVHGTCMHPDIQNDDFILTDATKTPLEGDCIVYRHIDGGLRVGRLVASDGFYATVENNVGGRVSMIIDMIQGVVVEVVRCQDADDLRTNGWRMVELVGDCQ